MKKILSFVLVLAMIASMMCVSVSAATTVDIVGSNSTSDDISAGVPGANNWPGQNYSVEANLGATVKNRYSVTIDYTTSDITLNGSAIWNVNTLQYEGSVTVDALTKLGYANDGSAATITSGTKLSGSVDVATFTVKNYSDLDVTVTIAKADSLTTYTDLKSTFEFDGGATTTTLDGAYVVAASDENLNEPDFVSVTAYVTSSDWAHVVAQLTANKGNNNDSTTFAAATYTISVAPATNDYSQD